MFAILELPNEAKILVPTKAVMVARQSQALFATRN